MIISISTPKKKVIAADLRGCVENWGTGHGMKGGEGPGMGGIRASVIDT